MARLAVGAVMLLGAMVAGGCGAGPAGPDAVEERTGAGIKVVGAGAELHPAVDERWADVERCWGAQESGERVTVTVQAPELYDREGRGVIRVNGTLVYGMRVGDRVWVAPDLGALRHEFSHLIGEAVTGRPVTDGAGRCWL